MTHVLVLGGTGEARRLAASLVAVPGLRVTSSLAGRVRAPALPVGDVRVGGFGGVGGLAAWLGEHDVDLVVDATHPFAATMTAHAAEACVLTSTPLLVLRRPGFDLDGTEHLVDTLAGAAALLPTLGERIFLTTGRQGLAAFAALDLWFLVRCVDPPEPPVPARLEVLLDRGPFTVDGERALMTDRRVDVLVTKDSGGAMTSAKLVAARELGIPVVVQRRPALPEGVPAVGTVEEAVTWVCGPSGPDPS